MPENRTAPPKGSRRDASNVNTSLSARLYRMLAGPRQLRHIHDQLEGRITALEAIIAKIEAGRLTGTGAAR